MRRNIPDSSSTRAFLGKHLAPLEVLVVFGVGRAVSGEGVVSVVFVLEIVSFGAVVACGASVAFGKEVTTGTGMAVALGTALVVGCAVDAEVVWGVDATVEGTAEVRGGALVLEGWQLFDEANRIFEVLLLYEPQQPL
jgi:hypothetical protein